MTDHVENIYLNALESLDFYNDKMKEAFGNLTGEEGKLDNRNIDDLLTDISTIFGVDMSQAKDYFSEANESISKYYDLNMISYQDFKEIFKMWLQTKSSKKQRHDNDNEERLHSLSHIEDKQNVNEGNKGNSARKVRRSVEANSQLSSIAGLDSQRARNIDRSFSVHTNLRSQNLEEAPKHYESNKEKLDDLITKHREEFYKKFEERRSAETETINLQDYFIFLQECFYMDEYLIMEKQTDEKDFFGSVNSFKRLLKIAQSYFVHNKEIDPNTFNAVEQQLTFDECFEILDYWFKTDDNVILTNEKPQPQPQPQPQISDNNNDVKKVLLETISKYKQMIEDSTNEVERQVLQTTIDTLYRKLSELETGEITTAEGQTRKENQLKNYKKREEKRMKALRETFEFYSKQQLNGGKPTSFENYERQYGTLNIGKFSVVLKNFRIKIDPIKFKETFKKVASNHEDLTFEEFYKLLEKVGKNAELIRETKIVKPNPEIRKEYKPDSYKTAPVPKGNARSESRKRDATGNPKSEFEKIEEMWEHMGLYDGTFRNNLMTVQLAFNSPEKETFRINPDILNSKPKNKLNDGNSVLELQERNEMRKIVRDVKAAEKSLLQNFRATPAKSTPKFEVTKKEESYAALKSGKPSRALPEKKLTLKQVGKSSYNDIGGVGAFNPFDLIEENDEEDNIYLAEYNLKSDKKLRRERTIEDLRNPDDHTKVATRKRQAAPGRYSHVFEYQSKMSGAVSNSVINLHQNNSKLALIDDLDYRKIADSTPNPTLANGGSKPLYVSQSVKHIGVTSNPKHLYYNPQYDSNPRGNNNLTPNPSSYPMAADNLYSYKRSGPHTLDRAHKIQQDSLKRGTELMNNIMNIQNAKLEQGLRVARK